MEREGRFWRVVLLALPLAVFAVLVIWPLAAGVLLSSIKTTREIALGAL